MGLSWKESAPEVVTEIVKPGFLGKMFGQKEQEIQVRKSADPIDLDSSVVCFDSSGNRVDTVWFRQYEGLNGAIQHKGDNRSGGTGVGDDERINIDLSLIPQIMAKLYRVGSGWDIKSIAEIGTGDSRTIEGLMPQILKLI